MAARQVAFSAASGSLFGWHWRKKNDDGTSVTPQRWLEQLAAEEILPAMRVAKYPSD